MCDSCDVMLFLHIGICYICERLLLLCSWWAPVKMFQLVYLVMRTRCVIRLLNSSVMPSVCDARLP